MASQAIQPWIEAANTMKSTRGMAEIRAALPDHIEADSLIRSFITAVRADKSGKLALASKDSLIQGVMMAAQLGLSLAPAMGHAYLVPFYDKHSRSTQAQFIPGYRGLIHLAYQTGLVTKISARPVYEGDEFDYEYGTEEKLVHKPTRGERGDLIATYCVAWLKSSDSPSFTVCELADIEKARRSSKAASSFGPWKTHYDEMSVKTAVRKHSKFIPQSPDDRASQILSKAVALDEMIDRVSTPKVVTLDDVEFEPVNVEQLPDEVELSADEITPTKRDLGVHSDEPPEDWQGSENDISGQKG